MAFTMNRIIESHNQRGSQQYLASYLKCSQTSVSRTIEQYFNDRYFINVVNSGR